MTIRYYVIQYLDLVLRGLIAFVFVGIGSYIVFVGLFKMKAIFVLPIAFFLSILISPFLSKIKLGEKLLIKYEGFLTKLFKKTIGNNDRK